MASIGHLAVGAALGALYVQTTDSPRPRRTIAAFAALALAPDLDLVTSFLGAPHGTALAHRGMTHSEPFALVVGVLIGLAAWRLFRAPGLWTALCAFLAVGSHGFLDTLSRHGAGPMLFWPFTTGTYEFPWRPIPGVESAAAYLTSQAIPTLVTESLLFLPFILYAGLIFFRRAPMPEVENIGLAAEETGSGGG
ncbi:MAG: metal-dependent hydrolase [Gemmatimonadales bacterium]